MKSSRQLIAHVNFIFFMDDFILLFWISVVFCWHWTKPHFWEFELHVPTQPAITIRIGKRESRLGERHMLSDAMDITFCSKSKCTLHRVLSIVHPLHHGNEKIIWCSVTDRQRTDAKKNTPTAERTFHEEEKYRISPKYVETCTEWMCRM